jgi:multiple sugar transport system permease protein
VTKKNIVGIARRQMRVAYAFIAPPLLYLIIFQIYPLFESIRLSFTDLTPVKAGSGSFIGLINFKILLFEDPYFWLTVKNTLIWVIAPTILQYTGGILIALVLCQKLIGMPVWRGLLMVPWIIPTVIAAVLWRWIYDGQYGLLNYYLGTRILWLGEQKLIWPSIVFMAFWKGISYASVMMLAGLQGIPVEIHEVVRLDGAGPIRKLFCVTFPLMRPVLYTSVATSIVLSWTKFEVIWALTKGGPGYYSSTLPTYIYSKSFLYNLFGQGSAVAVLSMIFMLIIILLYLRIFKVEDR